VSLFADVTPLRASRAFRRLWFGTAVSQLGQQMTAVAVAIQVYALTRSSFAVGMVGLAALVPLVAFGLYGGSLVDAHDRRRVALVTSTGLWVLSLALLAQAVLDVRSVGLLYALVAAQSAFFAVNNPARSAIVPRLLPMYLMPAANALSQVSFSAAFTLGPLLGGLAVGASGVGAAYLVDSVTFMAALWAIWNLPPLPPEGDVRRAGLTSVLEGLAFLRTRPNLLMTFLVDICAMVFGMPRALFPAVAGGFFGGGAGTVGILQAAPALGALVGALFSGWLGRVRRQGAAVLLSIVAWGLAITAFGFTTSLVLGVLFLALAGAADMVSAVFRGTILQVATPDALRGRLQGVFIVVVAGGPRLGDVEAGSVAALTSERVSVISGGLLCVLGVGLLAARWPRFARYDAHHPEP
jgi:MFS family permease